MTSDRDVYAAALLMIKRHGDKAWFEACLRSDALREKNDSTGVEIWDRICKAIEDLSSRPRGPSDALN